MARLQSITSQEFEGFVPICCVTSEWNRSKSLVARAKGIDGEGYLRVGPLVTTKVAFQCKRYSGAVSAKEVREFQSAIGSRAEKGVFFTTGYFTDSAREAARNTMSRPIELIDGDRLVELLEQNEFGLLESKTFEVDHAFLSNYKDEPKAKKN